VHVLEPEVKVRRKVSEWGKLRFESHGNWVLSPILAVKNLEAVYHFSGTTRKYFDHYMLLTIIKFRNLTVQYYDDEAFSYENCPVFEMRGKISPSEITTALDWRQKITFPSSIPFYEWKIKHIHSSGVIASLLHPSEFPFLHFKIHYGSTF